MADMTDEKLIAQEILKKLYGFANQGQMTPLMTLIHETEEQQATSIPMHFSLVHLGWVRCCEQGQLNCAIALSDYLIKHHRFQVDFQSNSAFLQALKNEQLSICDYLINHGADWMYHNHTGLIELLTHRKAKALHYLLDLCWKHDHNDTIQNHDCYLMEGYPSLMAYYQHHLEDDTLNWEEGKKVLSNFLLYYKLEEIEHDFPMSDSSIKETIIKI
jgi:hypothetical protein